MIYWLVSLESTINIESGKHSVRCIPLEIFLLPTGAQDTASIQLIPLYNFMKNVIFLQKNIQDKQVNCWIWWDMSMITGWNFIICISPSTWKTRWSPLQGWPCIKGSHRGVLVIFLKNYILKLTRYIRLIFLNIVRATWKYFFRYDLQWSQAIPV